MLLINVILCITIVINNVLIFKMVKDNREETRRYVAAALKAEDKPVAAATVAAGPRIPERTAEQEAERKLRNRLPLGLAGN